MLLFLLSACVGTRDLAPAPCLAPFVDASRFLPADMVSFAFMRQWPVLEFYETRGFTIWAGRDFEQPATWGLGPSRSIAITDLGHPGARQLLANYLRDCNPCEDCIGEHPCWWLPDALGKGLDQWYASADDRLILVAQHRETLASALAANGDLRAVLAPFGDLTFLPGDATDLIFNLSRAGEAEQWGRPVPVEPMVFAVSRDPWRLAMFSQHPAPKDYGELLGRSWIDKPPPTTKAGRWLCQLAEMKEQAPIFESTWSWLMWTMLFGTWVAI